jgi:hypothetical protein
MSDPSFVIVKKSNPPVCDKMQYIVVEPKNLHYTLFTWGVCKVIQSYWLHMRSGTVSVYFQVDDKEEYECNVGPCGVRSSSFIFIKNFAEFCENNNLSRDSLFRLIRITHTY